MGHFVIGHRGRFCFSDGLLRLIEGYMMRRTSIHAIILAMMLAAIVVSTSGCGAQLGETKAEGARRRKRIMRINNHVMMSDIDRMFLFGKPSRLTDKRIP